MILDKLLKYCDGQAFTDTAISESILDHTLAAHDLGDGEDITLIVTVAVAGADYTSIVITWETDDAEAVDSSTTVFTSKTIPVAECTVGAQLVNVTAPKAAWLRYSAVRVTFSDAGTLTLDASLVLDSDGPKKTYPIGYTVS